MEIFNPSEWERLKKIDAGKAQSEIDHIRERGSVKNFVNTKQAPNKSFNNPITLSSKKFNALIRGGFNPGTLYLVYGAYATGKTQIGFHTCVSLYDLYKDLDPQISTLFIDTEDTFRPERIQEIASQGYNLGDTTVFSRIRVLKATSTDMIFTLLKKIDSEGLDKEIKLIIIDSLTKHVRLDLGNQEISHIQVRDKLKRILGYLREITKQNNIVTILISQVTGFIAENSAFTERPIMEYVLNHFIDEIIYLNKTEDQRWAYLVNSETERNQKIPFKISTSGIVDQ
jgi:DNA repair protein RadA